MSRGDFTKNITTETGNQVNSATALSGNIEEIHMAVLGITRSELCSAPECPGTARLISALQEMGQEFVLRRFLSAFFKANFQCLPTRGGVVYTFHTFYIFHDKCKIPDHATWINPYLYIATRCHLLTLQKKNPINFEQECTT